MKIRLLRLRSQKGSRGFALIEAFIGVLLAAIVVGSLFTGISAGFREIATIREQIRASQIIVEKFETIRLYSWHQLSDPGFMPTNFTANFIPPVDGSTNSSGMVFTGTVKVENAPNTLPYAQHMKLVTIDLVWDSQSGRRTNTMNTLVSRYGIQNYVY